MSRSLLQDAKNKGLIIQQVFPASIGAELGWEPGDRLLSISGEGIFDIIDYQFQAAGEDIEVVVAKPGGIQLIFHIEKDYDEDLGISFTNVTNDGIRQCRNRCLFCFVDQMPPSLRSSLYVKDDDYRYSFSQGTFITLTNISGDELERIISLRLSPLYVSVHTTNPELRVKMLRNKKAAHIMDQLQLLAENGIQIHAQIVLCAGINDGFELQKSIKDLSQLWPSIQSLAVVPVGLTKFREGLALVEGIHLSRANETLRMVLNYQQHFLEQMGTRFVYLSDEFYLLLGQKLPPEESYEGFPQLENGVGIARLFLDEFYNALKKIHEPYDIQKSYLLATSRGAAPILTELVYQLNQRIIGSPIEMIVIENYFFGSTVTVAGLLSGADILREVGQALEKEDYSAVILPDILLNDDGLTLDNYPAEHLEERLGIKMVFLPCHGSSLVDYLFNND